MKPRQRDAGLRLGRQAGRLRLLSSMRLEKTRNSQRGALYGKDEKTCVAAKLLNILRPTHQVAEKRFCVCLVGSQVGIGFTIGNSVFPGGEKANGGCESALIKNQF